MHAMDNVKEIIVNPADKLMTIHYANGHIESVQCETLACHYMNNSTTLRVKQPRQWLEVHILGTTEPQPITKAR